MLFLRPKPSNRGIFPVDSLYPLGTDPRAKGETQIFQMSETGLCRKRAIPATVGRQASRQIQIQEASWLAHLRGRSTILAAGLLLASLWLDLAGCAASLPSAFFPSSRFVLYSESNPEEAQMLRLQAEAFLDDLEAYLGLQVPPGGLLRIVHFRRRVDLWSYLGQEIPTFRWRRGVCFEKTDHYELALSGRPAEAALLKTLRHELTHYFLIVHFSDFPPWIDEGLAQILAEGSPFPKPGLRKDDPPGAQSGRWSQADCLRVLHKQPGEKLTAFEYKLAQTLAARLIARSGDSLARLVRFLELSAADRDPSLVFGEAWGLNDEEACAELTAQEGL